MSSYQVSYDHQGRAYLTLTLPQPNLPPEDKKEEEKSERGVIIIDMFEDDA